VIDFLAKETHFVDHLAPVWFAMEGSRGTFFCLGNETYDHAVSLGIEATKGITVGGQTVVASIGDLKSARAVERRVAIMEHGCGLSYGGDRTAGLNNSYAGGIGRLAEVFLHPGEHPAARDRARYPEARVEVVGSPRLDSLPHRDHERWPSEKPVIAVSFHWDCIIAPETRSAFIPFRPYIQSLTKDFTVLGHGHPRIFDRLAPWYKRYGIEPVRDFLDVCRRADVYAVDNSSTLYEFASTGRPVVVLNSPAYRKDVNHGLRFWEAATVGPQVDDPRKFLDAAREALAQGASDPLREAALSKVYAYRSGAAKRAAEVLATWS
jgi:hypothetical protein